MEPNFDFRDAGFHILITSYQLLVSDEKYFRRVKWQYMVLDEAQAIKSANRSDHLALKTVLLFNLTPLISVIIYWEYGGSQSC